MVLRCSLLGHDFGDAEVEREREERGSEVVVTVREYEECSRCGEQNVLSENTEVTSLPTEARSRATDAAIDADADPHTALDEQTPEIDSDSGLDDREPASVSSEASADANADFESGSSSGSGSSSDSLETDPDHPTDEHGEPITDDAVILEDEDDSHASDSNREHGEWPESDDVGPPVGEQREPAAWPEVETDGESGSDAASAVDGGHDYQYEYDSEIEHEPEHDFDHDHGPDGEELTFEESAANGAGSGAAPTDDAIFVDAEPDDANGAGVEAESVTDSGTGIASAQSAPTPGDGTIPEDVPSEFYCPRCDFVAPDDRGSLRPGDICPDCRRGYIGERER